MAGGRNLDRTCELYFSVAAIQVFGTLSNRGVPTGIWTSPGT
jgi:hypothetical protein